MRDYEADIALQAMDRYDQAEAFISETVVNTVYIDGTRISNIETKREAGMMFRMAKDGRLGKSSVSLNSDDAVRNCIETADTVLSFSPETPSFKGYAVPAQAKIACPDVWDKKVVEITADDLRDLARRVIENCTVDIPRAQIRVSATESRTVNSNGVDVSHRSTLAYGHFTSMTRGDHAGEGMELYHGIGLDGLDPVRIGRSLSEKAVGSSNSKEFEGSRSLTMILPPDQLGDMLTSSVGSAINGENVKYGRSLWKDSVGKEVASPCIDVCDDPTVAAPLSCACDDEGTPTERRTIIGKGILGGFLRDTFCGDSTGNGMRRSSVEAQGAYDRTPTIKPLNLTVRPGSKSPEELIAETDEGILVERFAWPEADGLTGRFGLNVRCGHLVHKGEIVGTVSNALLMGNMLECIRNVACIGNDPVQMGVVTVPTMSFEGTELVGGN